MTLAQERSQEVGSGLTLADFRHIQWSLHSPQRLVSSGERRRVRRPAKLLSPKPLTRHGMGEQASPPPRRAELVAMEPGLVQPLCGPSPGLWIPRSRFRTSVEDSIIGDISSSVFIKAARLGEVDTIHLSPGAPGTFRSDPGPGLNL